ncbi:MAG: LapA family protein [bacterium]|nr:LapA family protein [bacterium]
MTQIPPSAGSERPPFDHQGHDSSAQKPRGRPNLRDLLREINVRMVLGGAAGIALVIFIAQNTEETQVHFLGWDWDLPVFLLLLITIGLSVVCTEIVRWYVGRRRRNRAAR